MFHILLTPNIITNLSSNTKILYLRQKFGNLDLAYGMLREHIFLAVKEKSSLEREWGHELCRSMPMVLFKEAKMMIWTLKSVAVWIKKQR